MRDIIAEIKKEIEEAAKFLDVSPQAGLDYVDAHEAHLKDLWASGMAIDEIADYVIIGL